MKLEDLFGEDLMERVANGEADVTIHITGDDDDGCDGCAEDSCPVVEGKKKEEEPEEDTESLVDKLLDSIFGSSEEDPELTESRKQAAESYKDSVKEFGKTRADAMLKISKSEATIMACIEEKIPLREKDIEEYNALVDEIFPDRPEIVKTLRYMRIDRAMSDGMDELLAVIGK